MEHDIVLKYIDGLAQDCSNSIVNALELLQSCAKPSICVHTLLCTHQTLEIRRACN